METLLLDDGFVVGSTSYCDVAAGLNELVGIYRSNRTCTVEQDSRHVFYFLFLLVSFLLAVERLELVLFVCCLLCELGTMDGWSYGYPQGVCWPCRAGKAYRRPRPTSTPQVCTLHWNYMYYIILFLFCPFFLSFLSLKENFSCMV